MTTETAQKITPAHLKRDAYLYIRQSTLRQVMENTESTERQYGLRSRAVALGWPQEQVVVIDSDQAHSGASAVDREGFQQLVTEVGLGRAGVVMGLVYRFIKTLPFTAYAAMSNLLQRWTTGAELISATPRKMRSFSSALDSTRMCRRKVRAILPNSVSTRLSQDPCFGVCT